MTSGLKRAEFLVNTLKNMRAGSPHNDLVVQTLSLLVAEIGELTLRYEAHSHILPTGRE